jgi:hypothetical protein
MNGINRKAFRQRMVFGAILLGLLLIGQCCFGEDAPELNWYVTASVNLSVPNKDNRPAIAAAVQRALEELRKEGVGVYVTTNQYGLPGYDAKSDVLKARFSWTAKTEHRIPADTAAKVHPILCRALAPEIAAGKATTDDACSIAVTLSQRKP